MVACPLVGASSVDSMRIVVVLPAPLGPRNPKIWFSPTARSTPRTASTALLRDANVLVSLCVSIIAIYRILSLGGWDGTWMTRNHHGKHGIASSPLSIHDAWGAGWCDHCEWPGAGARGWGRSSAFHRLIFAFAIGSQSRITPP